LEEIAQQFDREITVEGDAEFHIHDTRLLRARTRQEITSSSL